MKLYRSEFKEADINRIITNLEWIVGNVGADVLSFQGRKFINCQGKSTYVLDVYYEEKEYK